MRRRDFLKLSAVGAGVSLLEGCVGEREEFLVQVARRPGALQGESIWRPSVCGQCPAGCGVQVRVVDGDAKKIEGIPDHPVNDGGVCALGQSALQELYNPDRVTMPQRRSGARGDGRYEASTWEEALAEVVDALTGVAPERIAFVGSEPAGFVGALLRRFADALGAPAPAFVEPPGLDVERAAAALALGVDDVPYFDVGRSDYILSVGAPVLDRWRSPVHYTGRVAHQRRGRRGRRGRLVQAEARMSLTAANADEWLPIRPGTEGIFARAVAGILLSEGSIDTSGRTRYTTLFPGAAPTPEEAAQACDVPADRIARVAREMAAAERPVVVAGGSAAWAANGVFNVAAGLGLNLLIDGLGRPGGVFAPARLGLSERVSPAPAGRTPLSELSARLGGAGDPVDVLIVADADLLHALPASWGLEAALGDVGTVVALSSFADDTARLADVVLPLHTELERFNCVEPGASVGRRVLSVVQPAVEPIGDAHHPGDVLLALAAALGEPVSERFPWSSFAALVRETIESEVARLPGGEGATGSDAYFDAVERGWIADEGEPQAPPPGPVGAAPEAAAPRLDGDEATFPFLLVPFESLRMGDGRGANRPWLQEMPDPMSTVMWNGWAELSPDDARLLGVRDGDLLSIESPTGAIAVPAVVDPAVRPGLVGMPMGQGHRDYGRYARGRGANPLDLLSALRVDGTEAPALISSRVRIERAGPGTLARFGRDFEESSWPVVFEEGAP